MSVTLTYAMHHFSMMEQHHLFQLPYVEQLLPGTKMVFYSENQGTANAVIP